MEKIYKIRECRQDILRSKLQTEMLLNELRRWDKEDFAKHSPTYLSKMSVELLKLAEDIRDIQNTEDLLNIALLMGSTMQDHATVQGENK